MLRRLQQKRRQQQQQRRPPAARAARLCRMGLCSSCGHNCRWVDGAAGCWHLSSEPYLTWLCFLGAKHAGMTPKLCSCVCVCNMGLVSSSAHLARCQHSITAMAPQLTCRRTTERLLFHLACAPTCFFCNRLYVLQVETARRQQAESNLANMVALIGGDGEDGSSRA